MSLFRLPLFLVLACLPGAFLTFSLRLRSMSWWTKLLLGAALSPLILDLEYYAVRFIGFSFEHAVAALAIFNLLALAPMIAAAAGRVRRPHLAVLLGACFVLGVTYFALLPQLTNRAGIVYSTHAWMHAAPEYLTANGDLLLEESALAGVRLAYPWGGYVFQAILSYALNSTPVYSYIWTSALWIALLYGLAFVLASEIGISAEKAAFAPIWLFFGVNFASEVLTRISGHGIHIPAWTLGDFRYADWVWYFITPSQMQFAVAMLLALLIVLVRSSVWEERARNLALVGLLLLGIGFVYPVLFPAGLAVAGARVLADLLQKKSQMFRNCILLIAVSAAGTVLTFWNLAFITRDRTIPPVGLSNAAQTARLFHSNSHAGKAAECLVALSPLLLGLAMVGRPMWATRKLPMIVCAVGGLASAGVYVAVSMSGQFQNEYKFVFTAAACLFVFAAAAMERFMPRSAGKVLAASMALTLVLAAPLILRMYKYDPFWIVHGPEVQTAGFDVRLGGGERLASALTSIRTQTPADTIIAAEDVGIYLPVLTRRSLFVGANNEKAEPGVAIPTDKLLRVIKGYDSQLIDRRRAVQQNLFGAQNREQASQALDQTFGLQRPVAVLVDSRLHPALPQILAECGHGREIFKGHELSVWLFRPENLAAR